ncbi:hypothetical protein NUW54_g13385 [Trametes sanguinea]|uniref:Uncharacterized protein n=1 Tax=Trametes sanguinea TaxID=158606 RepID=A0ACC1MLG4_9APHY|nr:hypothetical protein NUW54_g13385 [Trametes sanguinea]
MVDNLPGPSGLAYTVDCSISDGEAACVAAASAFGMTSLVTTIEPASSIEVQVAAAATSAPPITDASGTATTTPTSAPSGGTGASGSAAPSSTKKPDNGAGGSGPSIAGFSVIAAVSVYFVCESVVMVVLSWRARRA